MRSLIAFILLVFAASLASAAPPDLPLVEVPATRAGGDTFAVLVSGDGGWAAIDKSLSRTLAANGVPVVGLNALQYFWTRRTPEQAANDLNTIISRYASSWKKPRVVLIGYSRGADVLPAMLRRLPPPARSSVRLLVLLAPSPSVTFQFHVMDWFHDSDKGMPVAPELAAVTTPTVCVWGSDDKESLCPALKQPNVKVITLAGSHHFDGNYEKLAQIVLEALH